MLQPKKPNISNKSKKKLFQLQGETNLVQKDNIPNTKRDLSLMLAEYNNAKKDEQELRTTGQIKNPNSIQYRRNIKTQPDIKQDNISTEQRNAQLNPLQRPLIYLANPEKVLGDLGVPNMETSELDRQAINANRFNPYQSGTDRFINNAKIGLGYVPEATVNTALATAFMPEGTGALGLVNETLNPLSGIKTSIPDSMKQGLNSQGFLDMFKSKPKFNIKDDHFYRSIGIEDAVSSGNIRSKQVGDYAGKNPYFVEGTDFDKLYSTGAGATSNKPEYIFEMPMVDKSGETMTANRVNQSSGYSPYVADKNQIPLSEGSIYKLNNKGEYEVFNTPKPTSNFKSEINWGKWNKEILENTQLIKEYNTIEQQAKANNTWMKNPDGSTFQGTPKKLQQGGNINQNNMSRYAQGGDLTQFNEGGLHSQNPLGGVPIGNNNSVEQGETKQNNFVYSNRIFLDENTVSQYNLPKSLVGKSVADATKFIDNKFKGRNDKISQSTKNSMLSKIAEAQESMKHQEPEVEQPEMGNQDIGQMAYGGGLADMDKAAAGSNAFGQAATTALDMAVPGLGQVANAGDALTSSIAGDSDLGKGIASAVSPIGMIKGLGAAISSGNISDIPIINAFTHNSSANKAKIKASNQNSINVNNQFSDKYALGGDLTPTKITTQQLQNTTILPNTAPVAQTDRFRYAVGEQGGVQHGASGEPGHYLFYGKKPGQPGFNPAIHREFVNQSGYDTYMKSPQGQQYRRNLSTQTLQPIEQLGCGGKMKKMGDGGFADNPFDEYSKRTLPQLNLQPINQVIPSFINKGTSINNAQAIIGTKVDGDFGKNSKLALDKYRQSKGMSNVGQPLSNVDYTAMGLTSDGYKINKNAFRQQLPENLNLKLDSPIEGFNKYTGIENNVEAGKDKKSLAGKGLSYVNDNLGNLARYAPIAANALQLAQLKKPQGERLDRLGNRYKPQYVDEVTLQNIANQTMNNSVNAIGQSGASQGQLRSSLVGSQLQRTKALSDAYNNATAQNRATNDRAQTFNLGVDQVNLGQSNTEKENYARDKGNYDTQKSKLIGQLGNDIGNIGKEEIYKKIAKTTTGYSWLGEYQKMNPNATPEETKVAAEKAGVLIDNNKTVKKQALGGYLIKNKK